jgi:hypothetical protein
LPNQQDGSDAGEANDRAQEMDAEHQDAIQYHRSIPWILVNEIPNRWNDLPSFRGSFLFGLPLSGLPDHDIETFDHAQAYWTRVLVPGFRASAHPALGPDRANGFDDLPMGTDGPRFDEPVMDSYSVEIPDDIAVNLKTAKALMLTVDESGGCRFSRWKPFPGVRGAPGVGSGGAGIGARGPRQMRSWTPSNGPAAALALIRQSDKRWHGLTV